MTPSDLRALADELLTESLGILNSSPDIADPDPVTDRDWFSSMLAMAVKTRIASDMLRGQARAMEVAGWN